PVETSKGMPQRLTSYRRAERKLAFGDENRCWRYRLIQGLIEGSGFMLGVEHVIPRSVTSVTAIVDRDRTINVSSALLKFRCAAARHHPGADQ
ncbi:MAG: hypothetical protein WB785_01330, partial [Mycobacterium sp.]|uniref:hypothetical protein n=1 Tax=Mycobacterium sp. TaxID=1785 RepID=UPI003C51C7CF